MRGRSPGREDYVNAFTFTCPIARAPRNFRIAPHVRSLNFVAARAGDPTIVARAVAWITEVLGLGLP